MVLALLYLTSFTEHGAMISDPKNKNKSVVLSEEAAKESARLFWKHFAKQQDVGRPKKKKFLSGGGLSMDLEMIVGFISLQVASGFLKEHGKEIYHKVKGLLTDDELTSLNLLEKYPESKELQDRFAGELKAHLETNPDIAEQLEGLIKKLPRGISAHWE